MKNIILTILLMSANISLFAVELEVNQAATSSSKLSKIQANITEYETIINEMPKKLQSKIENFERLKTIGDKVKSVLSDYIAATNECIKKAHSKIGEKVCQDFSALDLGKEIKEEKDKVKEMIVQAETELKDVRTQELDLPLVKKVLESLRTTKKMLMREGY